MTHHDDNLEPEERGSLTGYAAIKYGFIFLIVVAILFFLAFFVLRLFD